MLYVAKRTFSTECPATVLVAMLHATNACYSPWDRQHIKFLTSYLSSTLLCSKIYKQRRILVSEPKTIMVKSL